MSFQGHVRGVIGQISIYLAKQSVCQCQVIQVMCAVVGIATCLQSKSVNWFLYNGNFSDKVTMFTLHRNRCTYLKVSS